MNEPGPRPGHRQHQRAIVTRQPVIGGRPFAVVRPRYGPELNETIGVVERRRPAAAAPPPETIGALPRERTVVRRTARAAAIPIAESARAYRGIVALCLVVAVALGGIGAIGYTIYQSSMLRVNVAEVEGAAITNPNEIAGQAGLFDDSMLTADLEAAAARVREMPLIQDARIEKHWPRTVRIVVTERQPWGVWEQMGVAYTIDREGFVLGTTVAPPANAPVIRSSEQGSRIQGDQVDIHAVDAAARIWVDLPAELGVEVTEVAFLAGMGVQVTTSDGHVALFGDASGMDYKMAAWAAMDTEAERQGIVYNKIDLRFGNRPVLVQ